MVCHDRIAQNLADLGAVSLEDYLDGHCPAPPSQHGPASDGSAVTRLHQACQRAFRSTDALKFEFIEQSGSRNKQCILTITRPDGAQRSYATQPVFARKSEAKSEAARTAIDMGALDFMTSSRASAGPSDVVSCVDDIEHCCLEWRAGRVAPKWVPFSDPKLPHKQGCALCIRLSTHVARIYLSDATFDTHPDAKGACAKAAVSEGVLDFIKHGNGQTRPASPMPSTPSTSQSSATTPWTLQAFYDSLPRPFPESFDTNDASEINALGWMNTMTQNARGGKLLLSFYFTSDGPPGLHGCLLKLDRPGEHKASLVDARFPKRSDAKAAVCLQAMSDGIGAYIRSIVSTVDNKITPTMRSFSSSLVHPALTSALSKIETDLHPHVEYHKERDAFGATMRVRLPILPASEQERQYTVPSDYRSKADAKVAVVCHAAQQGVVEFVRFRGGPPPDGYVSPYSLHTYDPGASRKRKQPGSMEDVEQGQPARKKKKGKRRAGLASQSDVGLPTPVGQYLSVPTSGDQIHAMSGPSDMDLSQSVLAGNSFDPSQPGVGGGGGSGAAHPVVYGHGVPLNAQMYTSAYPAVLDPRFTGRDGPIGRGYSTHPPPGPSDGPSCDVDPAPPMIGSDRAAPGASLRTVRRPAEGVELEPGEVVSSAESEFSVGSSRNEEEDARPKERETGPDTSKQGSERVDTEIVAGRSDNKGKAKETSTSTTVSRDAPSTKATTTVTAPVSHVQNLTSYCAQHGCGTPLFHEMKSQGRFQVWIIIGKERFDLPTTYTTAEEGRQRVAKQVLARLSKGS